MVSLKSYAHAPGIVMEGGLCQNQINIHSWSGLVWSGVGSKLNRKSWIFFSFQGKSNSIDTYIHTYSRYIHTVHTYISVDYIIKSVHSARARGRGGERLTALSLETSRASEEAPHGLVGNTLGRTQGRTEGRRPWAKGANSELCEVGAGMPGEASLKLGSKDRYKERDIQRRIGRTRTSRAIAIQTNSDRYIALTNISISFLSQGFLRS